MFKRKKAPPVADPPRDDAATLTKELVKQYPCWSLKEIKAMQAQFTTWLKDSLTSNEVPAVYIVEKLKIVGNAFLHRALLLHGGYTVSFTEYIHVLSWFHRKGAIQEKREVLFRLYDVDNDGFVSPKDASYTMLTCISNSVDVQGIEETIRDRMKSSTKGLTPQEFNQMLKDNEVISIMSI